MIYFESLDLKQDSENLKQKLYDFFFEWNQQEIK